MVFPFGAIVSLAGQAASGIMSAMNNRKMQQAADAETARQVASNEAKAYENPLARSENQQAMAQYDRTSKQQLENARGVATITGATPEYALGVQKGIADGRAELMGGIAAGASAQKDKYLDKAEKVKERKFEDDQARRAARNTTYANLAANAASAFGGILDSYTAKTPTQESDVFTPEQRAHYNRVAKQTSAKAATSMAPTIQQAKAKISPVDLSAAAAKLNSANSQATANRPIIDRPNVWGLKK